MRNCIKGRSIPRAENHCSRRSLDAVRRGVSSDCPKATASKTEVLTDTAGCKENSALKNLFAFYHAVLLCAVPSYFSA